MTAIEAKAAGSLCARMTGGSHEERFDRCPFPVGQEPERGAWLDGYKEEIRNDPNRSPFTPRPAYLGEKRHSVPSGVKGRT